MKDDLIEKLVEYETNIHMDIFDKVIENKMDNGPRPTKLGLKIAKMALSSGLTTRYNRMHYNGQSRYPPIHRSFLKLGNSEEMISEVESIMQKKADLRVIVVEETRKLTEGKIPNMNEFEMAFSSALDQYGINKFKEVEFSYIDYSKKNVSIREQKVRNRMKNCSEFKIQERLRDFRFLEAVAEDWTHTFVDKMIEIHDKYQI